MYIAVFECFRLVFQLEGIRERKRKNPRRGYHQKQNVVGLLYWVPKPIYFTKKYLENLVRIAIIF